MEGAIAAKRPRAAVVVGASLAGLHAVESMRATGYDGKITLIGAEDHLPYDRPPLSKSVLTGLVPLESTILRPASHFDSLGVELRLGAPATGLDIDRRVVHIGGEGVAFDTLVVATGSVARRFAGSRGLENVHVLRTWDDAREVAKQFDRLPRVVIVGGGFIGGEVAASARRRGLEVTMVDIADLPMSPVLGRRLAEDYLQLHRDNGVRVLCGTAIRDLRGTTAIEAVELADGTVVPADLLLVGIGAVPCVDWLRRSGLDISDGVTCDATLRTVVPGIYAAGDVARCWTGNEWLRTAHWSDAKAQGVVAGRNATGVRPSTAFRDPPYFWSLLYGCRLQVVGRTAGADLSGVIVSEADMPGLGGTVALFTRASEVAGVCGWNATRCFNKLKAWFVACRVQRTRAAVSEAMRIIAAFGQQPDVA
jgi:NADPH-dependent 2,4-dienoyl-CoA reductase/sulfur reductase-like enzyme